MHPVNIKMIQFLTVLVVRDDDKSSGTNPDPQIFLEGLCGIERPYLSSSHFHKTKVCVNIITGLCVYVTEIMPLSLCTKTGEPLWEAHNQSGERYPSPA